MSLLKNVSQHGIANTIYSMVFDLVSGEIDIAMDRKYDQVYHFNLNMK
jgi:hypothetical protein